MTSWQTLPVLAILLFACGCVIVLNRFHRRLRLALALLLLGLAVLMVYPFNVLTATIGGLGLLWVLLVKPDVNRHEKRLYSVSLFLLGLAAVLSVVDHLIEPPRIASAAMQSHELPVFSVGILEEITASDDIEFISGPSLEVSRAGKHWRVMLYGILTSSSGAEQPLGFGVLLPGTDLELRSSDSLHVTELERCSVPDHTCLILETAVNGTGSYNLVAIWEPRIDRVGLASQRVSFGIAPVASVLPAMPLEEAVGPLLVSAHVRDQNWSLSSVAPTPIYESRSEVHWQLTDRLGMNAPYEIVITNDLSAFLVGRSGEIFALGAGLLLGALFERREADRSADVSGRRETQSTDPISVPLTKEPDVITDEGPPSPDGVDSND